MWSEVLGQANIMYSDRNQTSGYLWEVVTRKGHEGTFWVIVLWFYSLWVVIASLYTFIKFYTLDACTLWKFKLYQNSKCVKKKRAFSIVPVPKRTLRKPDVLVNVSLWDEPFQHEKTDSCHLFPGTLCSKTSWIITVQIKDAWETRMFLLLPCPSILNPVLGFCPSFTGYAVTAGHFSHLSTTDVVGGAPQDEGIGKVRRKTSVE